MSLKLVDIQAMHEAGRLAEAKQAYLDFIHGHPNDADAHHLLGILYAEEGALEQAQQSLEQAADFQPGNPSLILHLSNVLKARGLHDEGIRILQTVIEQRPDFAGAYNNLGTLYYAKEDYSQAINAYKIAINIQADYPDAYYNLGLALNKAKKREEAINVFESLLMLDKEHVGGRFQLGCLLMQQNRNKEAIEQFNHIAALHPFHFETQANLAACAMRLGHLNQAKAHYLKALDIVPDDAQLHFNLGVINMHQGFLKEAIQFYTQALAISPVFFEAQNNLGIVYMVMHDMKKALLHFREALRADPENAAVKHTINILTGEKTLTGSPPEYIQALFDSYAGHYDTHLVKALHYQVPQAMSQLMREAMENRKGQWDILDLGCGTGLCAPFFREAARRLTGVDLSENMLTVAAQKDLYDELIKSDLQPYLEKKQAAYDVVIAGDVLVYFGELEKVFASVAAALKPQGYFIFNVESGSQAAYAMTESGRFAHSLGYMRELASRHQFEVRAIETMTLRTQNETAITGYLILLQRDIAH